MPRIGKRKLYIHIGLPKTGSTSIQQMLHRLSPSLEQVGVHVVAASADGGRHRLEMPMAYERGDRFPAVEANWRALSEELRRCAAPRLVVSNENFSRPRERAHCVPRFAELACSLNLDVEVVACVRPQWQWVEAYYTELIHAMAVVPPFPDWLEAGLNDYHADLEGVAAPWKEAFGRVTVLPIERSRLPNGLLSRVLEFMGVHDDAIVAAAQRLPRLKARAGAKAVEVERLLSIALHSHGLTQQQRLQALHRLGPLSKALCDDLPFAGLTRDQIDAIAKRFAASNARFARSYGVAGALFQDAPIDRFSRPSRAAWRDLSAAERRKVNDLARRKIGVTLPDGAKVGRDEALRAGQATLVQVVAEFSVPGKPSILDWGRATAASGAVLLRGLAQTRSPAGALAVLRWLRWQVFGLLRRASQLARR